MGKSTAPFAASEVVALASGMAGSAEGTVARWTSFVCGAPDAIWPCFIPLL